MTLLSFCLPYGIPETLTKNTATDIKLMPLAISLCQGTYFLVCLPIKNAIIYSISNGLIEGLNNKNKALKRSMYGRASDKLFWIKMYQTGLMKLQQI